MKSFTTLDTIRKEFGWAYASYWVVDPAETEDPRG